MLSGFLLSLPWVRCAKSKIHVKPDIRYYYIARAMRILPLYLVWILLALIATGEWGNAAKALTFQFIGFGMFPFGVVWWTLTTEVQFYLFIPLAWWAWLSGGWYRFILSICMLMWLSAYTAVFGFGVVEHPAFSYWLTKSLFGRLPAFLVGISCAVVFVTYEHSGKATRLLSNKVAATFSFVALFALLWLTLSSTLKQSGWVNESEWHIHHTVEALLWGAILLLLTRTSSLFSFILVNPVAAFFGKVSYSIYLSHVPILYFVIYGVKERVGVDVYLDSGAVYYVPLLALLLVTMVSTVTYRSIERPFLMLKNQLPQRS